MFQLILAYAAGLLTVINPCVLPLLPMIAAGAVSRHPLAPVAMAGGMAVSFTLAGMGAFALTRALGLVPEDISFAAGLLMIGFGLVMLVPAAQGGFAKLAGATASGSTQLMASVEGRGLGGEALAGALLGLAWSPCVGPTLGAAIGFAATGENLLVATATMVAFGLGSATVMMALAYGTRGLIARRRDVLSRFMPYAKPVLGGAMLLVGLGIVFHVDRVIEGLLLDILPAGLVDFSVSI